MTSRKYKIGELGKVVTGKTPSTGKPEYWSGEYPFITIPDLSDLPYVEYSYRTLSESGAAAIKSQLLPGNSVLMSCIATIGKCGITTKPSFTNQQINAVIPNDKVNPLFLLYLFRNLGAEMTKYGSGGTVYSNISKSLFESIEVEIPESLNTQLAIANVLASLDAKIAINKSLSKTLEDIAQTIFKSWFIDFNPVKAKMAGEKPAGMDEATAALFPDTMEESELGLIPKGWEVTALGDICATTIGGLWGNDEKSLENSDSYQCIRGVDMDDLKALGYAPRVPIRWDKLHNFSKRLLSGTQILIAGSGAGPVAKSLLWDESMNILFSKPVVFSNFVKRFECNSNEMASFVSSILTNMYESREIFTFVNGTSVPNLQDRELLIGKKVAVPSIDLLRAYDSIKRTSIKRKYSGENSNLVAIRDSLLPRLISGELQIPTEILSS